MTFPVRQTRRSWIAAIPIVALLAAACGTATPSGPVGASVPPASGSEVPGEPVSITIWTPPLFQNIKGFEDQSEEPGDFVQYLVDQYNAENPTSTVDLDVVSFGDIEQKITTAVAGNVGPDIYVDVSPRLYSQWRTGAFEAVDDVYSDEEDADFLDAALEISKVPGSGEQFFVPLSNNIDDRLVLVEDFWAEKGLLDLIPEANGTWTVDEFETAMTAIADPENDVYPLCGEFASPGAMDQVRFVYQNGGLPFTADDSAVATENLEKYVRGLTTVHEWYKKGWFVPEPQAFIDGDCWLQFPQKTVAVLFFPDNAAGIAKDALEQGAAPPYTTRFVAWPTFEGEKPNYISTGIGFMVKKQDDEAKRAAIHAFVRWMTSTEQMTTFTSDTVYSAWVYARKSVPFDDYISGPAFFEQQQAIQSDDRYEGRLQGFGVYSGAYTATRGCAAPEWQAVFNGDKTPEQGAEAIFACNQAALDSVK